MEIKNTNLQQEQRTKAIATYIFIFFLLVILIIVGYFLYTKYFQKNNNNSEIDFSFLIDSDFNKIFLDIKKQEQKVPDVGYEKIKTPDCFYKGKHLKHGEQIILYSREFVDPYDSCEYYKAVRMCSAGFLAGEERFRYFTCEKIVDCVTNDNGIIKNGNYVELYSKSEVPFGKTCEQYKGKVRCADGQLIGDKTFRYKNCTVSLTDACNIDNNILGNGKSHIFYKKNIVNLEENCSDFTLRRHCDSGHLEGDKDYKYWSCHKAAAKNCYLSGIEIPHGTSKVFYSKKYRTRDKDCDFFADIRKCYDGVLSGLDEYSYLNCQ